MNRHSALLIACCRRLICCSWRCRWPFLKSEFLAGSAEAACKSLGLTEVFAGVIIIAIIGNASEFTAVLAALKDQMDLSLSIAVVEPPDRLIHHSCSHFCLLLVRAPNDAGIFAPRGGCSLLAVGIVVLISGDGECNWFEGAQLLAVYLIIAVLFFSSSTVKGTAGPEKTGAIFLRPVFSFILTFIGQTGKSTGNILLV